MTDRRAFSLDRLVSAEAMTWVLGATLGILYVAGVTFFRSIPPLVDEHFHLAQETLFFHGQWRLVPELTTIPGYHLFLAGVMRLLDTNALDTARIVHSVSCLTAVAGFFALRRRLWPGTETIASAQFLCLPLLATLFFVIYTDVPAVALLLWATWAAVAGRIFLSALLLCLLVVVRQHEFLWSVFLIALVARPPPRMVRASSTMAHKVHFGIPIDFPDRALPCVLALEWNDLPFADAGVRAS